MNEQDVFRCGSLRNSRNGKAILFAFSEDLRPAGLAFLLSKFEARGSQRITRGKRELVVVDGPVPP
ncbi:MAG: hypothetical protein AAF193_08225, partial [Bacteroidota bacterium]